MAAIMQTIGCCYSVIKCMKLFKASNKTNVVFFWAHQNVRNMQDVHGNGDGNGVGWNWDVWVANVYVEHSWTKQCNWIPRAFSPNQSIFMLSKYSTIQIQCSNNGK